MLQASHRSELGRSKDLPSKPPRYAGSAFAYPHIFLFCAFDPMMRLYIVSDGMCPFGGHVDFRLLYIYKEIQMKHGFWLIAMACTLALTGCKKDKKHHYGPHHHSGMTHDFSDTKKFAKMFDNPKRNAWQKPQEVVRLLELKPGMHVADIGAGTGYFLPHLIKGLSGKGMVYGLDVNKHMVKHMQDRIKKAGWKNVVARKIPGDTPDLKDGSIDRIIIVNTWHHIPKRVAYSKKLHAALRKNGAVYVIDFTKDSKHGPSKKHRLSPELVVKELKAAGLKTTIMKETLPNQYIVRGSKS